MNYLHQEKSLRDHEPYLRGFAAIAGKGIAYRGASTRELSILSERGTFVSDEANLADLCHSRSLSVSIRGRRASVCEARACTPDECAAHAELPGNLRSGKSIRLGHDHDVGG
jgi:hypothetical protein